MQVRGGTRISAAAVVYVIRSSAEGKSKPAPYGPVSLETRVTGAGISSGEHWPWFINSFSASHYDKNMSGFV